MIYTAEEKYTVKTSSYSNNVISSNSALRPSQFLTMAIDVEERRQLEENLRVRDAHQSLHISLLVMLPLHAKYFNKIPLTRCPQAAGERVRNIDERMAAIREQLTVLCRRDNELRSKKKQLSELKGKKRNLEQKISTKQDRYLLPNQT